jgi:hypothetical protein
MREKPLSDLHISRLRFIDDETASSLADISAAGEKADYYCQNSYA